MNNQSFETPVAVEVGMGSKLEIRNLADIHQFLIDWPPSRRGPVHSTAIRACDAARIGHLTTEQARRAFVEFAKCHQILWPDIDAVIAGNTTTSFNRHI